MMTFDSQRVPSSAATRGSDVHGRMRSHPDVTAALPYDWDDDDCGYPPDSPKHPSFYERYAEAADWGTD